MPRTKKQDNPEAGSRLMRPALTPRSREDQLIALATNVAEQKLRDGTASSQLITHYLRVAADREREELEKELLAEKKKLMEAKIKSLESERRIEELYLNAVNAMRTYTGQSNNDSEAEEDEDVY